MISELEQTAAQRRNLLFLGVAGGLGIAGLVVLLATLLLTGSVAAAATPNKEVISVEKIGSFCVDTKYRDLGRKHTENIRAKITYNSFPPTSGMHYAEAGRWGNYPSPVAPVQQIHNLEHGGIVIQYGDRVTKADRNALFAYYDDDPNGILMAPLPVIGTRIAATAWTHLMVCQKFDKGALNTFKKKYRYKGPEAIPKEGLEPGR